MKNRALFTLYAIVLALLISNDGASAQEQEVQKVEIGVHYSSLSINLPGFGGTENAPGVGATNAPSSRNPWRKGQVGERSAAKSQT